MTDITFSTLGVPAPLVAALAADGKTSPFPIQVDTLPDTLAGRDVLGRGKTGSGKTLAFSLPMVARLGGALAGGKRRPGRPLGLVLAPTRELATQIDAVLAPLAAAYGMKTTTIFGGISQKRQVDALRAGVDIVVACPGRLEDLMKQGHVTLDAVEITVLDEADHMADLGFLPVVTRIMGKTPQGGQRLLFSATLDNGVDKLVKRFLQNEVLHSVDEATSHVAAMTHHVFEVDDVDAKNELVKTLASGTGRRILFMRTKHHAKKLAKKLTEQGIPAVDLHGNLSQPQRDRNLAAFGDGSVKVLVATDVAARGVHVDDVELVIHVDPPMEHKAYLHRSGRTARAGSEGDVVTICLPAQKQDLKTLLRKAAITVTPAARHRRVASRHRARRRRRAVREARPARRGAAGRRRPVAGRERPAQARRPRRPARRRRSGPRSRPWQRRRLVGRRARAPRAGTGRVVPPRRRRTRRSRARATAAAPSPRARSAGHPLARARPSSRSAWAASCSPARSNRRAQG